MSSLSAARADNYYYPREWRPEHGSINAFQKSHALGKRAKDLATQGVLVVRFEMPFNVWCTHCESHIGRGVRFNARKKKCGMYFTTILYEFALTCAHCQGEMVIRTDPESRGYALVSGVRKKVEGADVLNDGDTTIISTNLSAGEYEALIANQGHELGTERLNDPQVGVKLQQDPFFRLEHENEDKRVATKCAKGLEALLELKDAHDKDNYASNSSLRAAFRAKKKQIKKREDEGERRGLSIPLLDVHEDDVVAAKAVLYKNIPGKKRASSSSAVSSSSIHKRENQRAMVPVMRNNNSKSHTTTASRAPRTADSFQHFGDAMGSQLHRLKQAKAAQKQQQQHRAKASSSSTGSSSTKRKAASNSGSGSGKTALCSQTRGRSRCALRHTGTVAHGNELLVLAVSTVEAAGVQVRDTIAAADERSVSSIAFGVALAAGDENAGTMGRELEPWSRALRELEFASGADRRLLLMLQLMASRAKREHQATALRWLMKAAWRPLRLLVDGHVERGLGVHFVLMSEVEFGNNRWKEGDPGTQEIRDQDTAAAIPIRWRQTVPRFACAGL